MKRRWRACRQALLAMLCCLTLALSSAGSLAVYADNGENIAATEMQEGGDTDDASAEAIEQYLAAAGALSGALEAADEELSNAYDEGGSVLESSKETIQQTMQELQDLIKQAESAYDALDDAAKEQDGVDEASAIVESAREAVQIMQDMIAETEEEESDNNASHPETADGSDDVTFSICDINDEEGTCALRQVVLSNGATAPETLVIPETVEHNGKTYTVTDINGYSMGALTKGDFSNTTAIVLPKSLTKISQASFGLHNVKTITIPGNVKTFKGDFQNCTSLESLIFEEGVEQILGENETLFNDSVPVTTISLPDTLTKMTANFGNAVKLESIQFPDGCDLSEAQNLLYGCESLKEVTLPAATHTIPWQAFSGCTSLEKVTANGTITKIEGSAFSECAALTEIPDLSKVTGMGSYAFYDCKSLTQKVDLSSLDEIPEYAFVYAPITVTKLSDNLTAIGEWGFVSATLQETSEGTLTLPSTLTSIGYCALWNTGLPAKVVIPDSVTEVGTYTFGCANGMEEVYIGSGLTTIPENMFYEVSGLKKIVVNNSKDNITGTENFPDGVEVIYLIASVDATDDKISNAVDALTLQQAVDAAKDGDTITLEKDVRLSKTLNIPAGKSITIASKEGATYTIVAEKSAGLGELISAVEGSDITFRNVNLYGRDIASSVLDSAGKVTLDEDVRVCLGNLREENSGVVNVHGSKAELVIDGAIIDNNTISGNYSASVRVADGASVEIESGEVKNNTYTETYYGYGTSGLLLEGNASGKMTGGTISGNTARRGAAIKLNGSDQSNRTTFALTGGVITGNKNTDGDTDMSSAAGAVYMCDNASMTMSGGEISGNKGGNGGAVTVVDWKLQNHDGEYETSFVMNGGSMTGNHARNGGAIYSFSNGVELNAGTISGNTASVLGGGVYSEGNKDAYSTMRINNVSVRNNDAEIGGGLWLCPTGDAKVHVKSGGIIYNNSGEKAADDVASARKFGEQYSLTLENRVLGGGKVEWHQDGLLYGSTERSPYPQATGEKRYVQDSEALDIVESTDYEALKAVISEADIAKANAQASLVIENNTALNGGGIAANGGVDIGEPDNVTIKVIKVWKLDDGKTAAKSVAVQLLRDGEAYGDAVTLSADNQWTYAWENLDGGYDWTVKETNVPDGFKATVTREDSKGLVKFTITNDDKPDDSDEPENPHHPHHPDEPDKPQAEQPETPQVEQPGVVIETPTIATEETIKATGDSSHMALYGAVAAIAAMLLMVWVISRKCHNASASR